MCFLFVGSLGAQTNKYHPFPDSNAVWSETDYLNTCNCPNPCATACGFYDNYFIKGDILKGSYTYHKIYNTSQYFQYNGIAPAGTGFYAGIRQDTVARKVYCFVYGTGTNDTLLYDFNLHVGDTLPKSYVNGGTFNNHVSSIDSIIIGTTYRRQYHISSTNPPDSNYVQLIEGIGSTFGITSYLAPPFEGGYILNCFTQNDVTQYTNPMASSNCNLTMGVKTINRQLTFQIYPNPAANSFQVSISGNSTIKEITVYDMLGNIVLNPTKTNIDVSSLANGVYFINLQTSEGFLTKKLIVQR